MKQVVLADPAEFSVLPRLQVQLQQEPGSNSKAWVSGK